jgi:prepilin-type N-terminal cleavage/methylation domain-containing protein
MTAEGAIVPGARSAFTLLEMLIVVALASILATVTAVSFAGAYRSARARDVADQVARYDRLAREASRRFGRPGRLTFDLDQGVVSRTPAAGTAPEGDEPSGDRGGTTPAALHLPAGFRIARLVSARTTATAGRVSLPCSTRGQTPSYALSIVGPKGDGSWLIVAGLTGKVQSAIDANEAEDIFRALAGETPDGAAPDGVSPAGAGDDAR